MDKSKKVKNNLIELMQQLVDKKISEKYLIDYLNDAVENKELKKLVFDVKNDTCIYADNCEKRLLNEYGETKFKKYKLSVCRKYNYYVSDVGRIMLVPVSFSDDLISDIGNKEFYIIPLTNINKDNIKDGNLYLDREAFWKMNNRKFDNYRFTTSKSIHVFVSETWLDKKDYDGLEAHHINDCGYDNRVVNLILLPKNIHSKVNKTNK